MPTTPKYEKGTYGSIVPQTTATLDSSVLAPQPNIQLPPNYTVANGPAMNAGISVPTATPEATAPNQSTQSSADIVNSAYQPTGTDSLLSQVTRNIQSLLGNQQSPTQLQAQADTANKVSGLAKTRQSLQNQLTGLNDQQTLLQLAAAPGGSIENQMQLNATGRGVTAGGLAPHTAAALRENQIQQNALAAQSLSVKAAYLAANDDYVNAKAAADRAAQLAFDAQEQQLKYQQSALEAVKFQLGREDDRRKMLVQAQLAEKQQQIGWQREDYQTGQAMAIAALKLNPNDPRAQYNAQQALRLDPTDPQYLQKVANLVGTYQQNPMDTQNALLDQQYKRAQIANIYNDMKLTEAQRQKVLSETTASAPEAAKKQLQNNEALTLALQLRDDGTPGKGSAVGASFAKLVPFGQALGLQGNRTSFEAKVNTLKANLTLDNLKLLKGAMSDKDLLFLNSVGSSLDVNMSQSQFNSELDRIITKLQGAGATAAEDTHVYNGTTYKLINRQWVAQ